MMPQKNSPYDQASNAFGPDAASEWTGSGAFGRQSGILFEQAMAQTRMAVALADPYADDIPLVFVNNAFIKLTGYSEEEVIGRNCRFLQGPDTDPQAIQRIRDAVAEGKSLRLELLACCTQCWGWVPKTRAAYYT